MNSVALIGRTTKDPEVKENVVRFSLAVPRRKEGEADFISCVAFGKTAEFAAKYVKKGARYGVTGRIQTGSYEGRNGRVYTTDVIADSIYFCERKQDDFIPTDEDPFA